MGQEFTTAAKRRQAITFTLDGEDFTFTPPKQAMAVLPMFDPSLNSGGQDMELAVTKAAFDWLGAGLPEEQHQRLVDRLKDSADDFDTDDLGDILRWLQAQVSGRPTS